MFFSKPGGEFKKQKMPNPGKMTYLPSNNPIKPNTHRQQIDMPGSTIY